MAKQYLLDDGKIVDWEVEDECRKCVFYYKEKVESGPYDVACKNPHFDRDVDPRSHPCRGFTEWSNVDPWTTQYL